MSAALATAPIAPAKNRLATCLDFVLRWEGGFVNDPRDRGGATNRGITLATLADWRGHAVTAEDVRAMGEDEARAIYGARYWNAVRAGDLAPGLDLLAFDMAVNSGPGTSARLLQRVVGATADGVIGPQTLARVRAMEPRGLAGRLCDERLRYLQGLDDWSAFGKGWTRRVEDARVTALRDLPAAAPGPIALAGFSAAEAKMLAGCHPDLLRVLRRVRRDGPGFRVAEGLRTVERQRELVAAKMSKTMNSRHITGHAADLYPLGLANPNDRAGYLPLVDAVKAAARAEAVPMTHGYDWGWDAPHHELTWAGYPA